MSGFIKVDVIPNLGVFRKIVKQFPSFSYGLLSEIGYQGRRALYEDYLQGSVINLSNYPYDSAQRRMVLFSLAKNKKGVKISAYPLNLYDPRSVYNSAESSVKSRIVSGLEVYDKKVLQKRIDQMDKKK